LNHSYGALTHLRRIPPLSSLLCHGSNLSRKGASGKPGEVHLPVAAFAGARLDRGILLSRASDGEDLRAHRGALKEALILSDKNERQVALKALEGGALQIKLALEQASDRLCEQRFYRLELRARRKQSGTPWTEKFFSWAYAAISNYGASMGWPFVWLLGVILVFALLYWGAATEFRINLGAPVAWCALIDAFNVSLSRIFPFGAFEEVTKDWIAAREVQHGGLAAISLRILASLQSAFALVLLFLFGLAVRRRFQIS
ncbi:MAG: hypothetical protein ACK4MQ_09120, partial [Hyphomonas sp.]